MLTGTQVSVEGNIGSGKTTILHKLQADWGMAVRTEPVAHWEPLLSKFYSDPKRWAFALQMHILKVAMQQGLTAGKELTERTMHSAVHVFSKVQLQEGNMSQEEYDIVEHFYKREWAIPRAVVYVRASPELCHERCVSRAREAEAGIGLGYLQTLDAAHERYMGLLRDLGVPVLVLENGRGVCVRELAREASLFLASVN